MKDSQDKTDAMDRPVRQPVIERISLEAFPVTFPEAEGWTPVEIKKRIDFADVRARLADKKGKAFWRGLEELARTPAFTQWVEHEFPRHHAVLGAVDRREFLKLAGASMALAGLTACTKQPLEKIVPYVKAAEEAIPGKPLYFATAMTLGGYAMGLLAESHLGRPTKIEGNPDHPASLGGTDLFAQASILDLYDPDRSQSMLHKGRVSAWDYFLKDVEHILSSQTAVQGAGLRILTETVTSPTLGQQLNEVLRKFPKAKWVQYEPAGRDTIRAGARQAFGEYVETLYMFDKADVVLSLDADFLYTGPGRVRYAHDFASRRTVTDSRLNLNRLYVAESTPSVTGTNADHRLPLKHARIEDLARAVAQGVGAQTSGHAGGLDQVWVDAVINDLKRHRGTSIVLAGEQQPPVVHALAHHINEALGNIGNTVIYTEPIEANPMDQNGSLIELVKDMEAGAVDILLILGGNPVYNAPVDLDFAVHMNKVGTCIHAGSHVDETARLCHWHVPLAHYLESWSDARAYDGTISIAQPLIEPLYSGKTLHEVVAALLGQGGRPAYELVQAYWKEHMPGGYSESAWRKALHDGMVSGSRARPKQVSLKKSLAPQEPGGSDHEGLEIQFRPDPSLSDGRFANNGWLQELPKPITKLTWDNAVLLSPATAERLGTQNEDVIEITYDGRSLKCPVWVTPGQPDDSLLLHLGYGRKRAGQVGTDVGFDAYALRPSSAPWGGHGVKVSGPVGRYSLASTQHHYPMDVSKAAERRHLIRTATRDVFAEHPDFAQHVEHTPSDDMTLYKPYDYSKGEQWGMTINLNTCIGCNACVVACQSENNIPVVGKEEVGNGREMHWIRVDSYHEGDLDNPGIHHQPVTCMHCENAPCEPVCPVGATVHSQDGLNQMVYNRCVGTRYCSNNCPYKVRRFNFYQYTDLETPSKKLLRNPDVTVRVRGVMEKCTYCVQRISAARIEAKKDKREVRDGEVVSACQQACPTKAIMFGNINDAESAVAKQKASSLNYTLLADLNTVPRTSYWAKVTNPNSALDDRPHDPPGETTDGHG